MASKAAANGKVGEARANSQREDKRAGGGQETGWTTGNHRTSKAFNGEAKGQEERGKSGSPRKWQPGTKTPDRVKSSGVGTNKKGPVEKDVAYVQLRIYIYEEAPSAYITQLVERMAQQGKEKRFRSYLSGIPKQQREWDGDEQLRKEWQDVMSAEMKERYAEIESNWELSKEVHAKRLVELMKEWITVQKLPIAEIENRLRVLHFVDTTSKEQANDQECKKPSYIGAVNTGLHRRSQVELTATQQRLRDLCLQPAATLTKLRPRTAEENAALQMIVTQEIEAPYPPHFLVQSMDAEELAKFADYLLGIEYPLFAQLAPGQRFSDNLPRPALMALIYTGNEAAQQHKQEVQEFKEAVSRISLDMDTRLIKVTFKGKNTAQGWAKWKMPVATRLLPLIDYVSQKEAAKETHELVDLDYYVFTVEVKRGKVTSADMYWVLTTKLDITVQEMRHPEIEGAGVNDKRWTVRVKAEGCPKKLKTLALIKAGDDEITVWHHKVHVSRPCGHCLSPLHMARMCRDTHAEAESARRSHTWQIEATLPSLEITLFSHEPI